MPKAIPPMVGRPANKRPSSPLGYRVSGGARRAASSRIDFGSKGSVVTAPSPKIVVFTPDWKSKVTELGSERGPAAAEARRLAVSLGKLGSSAGEAGSAALEETSRLGARA